MLFIAITRLMAACAIHITFVYAAHAAVTTPQPLLFQVEALAATLTLRHRAPFSIFSHCFGKIIYATRRHDDARYATRRHAPISSLSPIRRFYLLFMPPSLRAGAKHVLHFVIQPYRLRHDTPEYTPRCYQRGDNIMLRGFAREGAILYIKMKQRVEAI